MLFSSNTSLKTNRILKPQGIEGASWFAGKLFYSQSPWGSPCSWDSQEETLLCCAGLTMLRGSQTGDLWAFLLPESLTEGPSFEVLFCSAQAEPRDLPPHCSGPSRWGDKGPPACSRWGPAPFSDPWLGGGVLSECLLRVGWETCCTPPFYPTGQQEGAAVTPFKPSLQSCELTKVTLSPTTLASSESMGWQLHLLPLAFGAPAPHWISELCLQAHVSAVKLSVEEDKGTLFCSLFLGHCHVGHLYFLMSILSSCQTSKKNLYPKHFKCLTMSLSQHDNT